MPVFRLLSYNEPRADTVSSGMGTWKQVGGDIVADTAADALHEHHPVAGDWLVLNQDDGTYRLFVVKKRTETDIEPLGYSGGISWPDGAQAEAAASNREQKT